MCPPYQEMRRRTALRSKSVNFEAGELLELFRNAQPFAPIEMDDLVVDDGISVEFSVANDALLPFKRQRANTISSHVFQVATFGSSAVVSSKTSMRRNFSAQAVLLKSVAEHVTSAPVHDKPFPSTTTTTAAADGPSVAVEEEPAERQRSARSSSQVFSKKQFMKGLKHKIDEAKRRHRARSISDGSEAKPTWRSVLPQLTQPAHMIVVFAAIALGYVLKPTTERHSEFSSFHRFCGICHVVAFTTQFGSQMWMTFVSGLALFFQIPRHTFGIVQRILFPLYFMLNSVWAFIVLASYKRLHDDKMVEIDFLDSASAGAVDPLDSMSTKIAAASPAPASGLIDVFFRQINSQVVILTLAFVIQLAVRLFLAPALVKLMDAKTEIEKAAGIGLEVGKYDLGALGKCPHFMRMHKAFRRVHMSIAICNMVAMFLNCMHLLHLANIVVDNFN